MTNAQWFLLVGCLMLAMGLNLSVIRRLPVTSAIIYLAVGVLVGPMVLALFHFNPLKESALLETLTEMAVLISLFAAGVKMPVPFRWLRWRTPILLASVSMVLTVALVAVFARYVLDLPWGLGVLLGAIVSPTDPVLATDVQTRHPGDSDRLRFSLTCEAGMNDGSAFPFVMLGMGLLDVATVSEGSLVFKEHLERLSEILLVLLVGGTLFLDSWSWRGVGFACFLFVVARPVSVLLGLSGSATPLRIRAMAAWFGVRGIGSLYYLMYAIDHGLPEPMAVELIHLTLIVVTLSILVHGVSVKPLMERFQERRS